MLRYTPITLHTKQFGTSQKPQQWQQRQTEDGEVIALDMLEQMDAQPFKLVGADACGDRNAAVDPG